MDKQEKIRLHLDWYGRCRTCSHWKGDRTTVLKPGRCSNPECDMYNHVTWTDGGRVDCKCWFSFAPSVASEVKEGKHSVKR